MRRFWDFPAAAFFYLLMLEPSLTFWTASLGKESVMTLAVGLYTYGVVKWWRTRRERHLLQAAIGSCAREPDSNLDGGHHDRPV